MPDLEAFDTDHLPPHLHDVGEPFRELMLFLQFNVPAGEALDDATKLLLGARDKAYQAITQDRREKRLAADQLALDLGPGGVDPGALRFPSWPHIPPQDETTLD